MLFLAISTPAPTEPSAVRDRRQRYWEWVAPLRQDGTVRSIHARVGRGAVALFDVDSLEKLHALLNQWADIVPATFEILPLIDAEAIQSFLAAEPT